MPKSGVVQSCQQAGSEKFSSFFAQIRNRLAGSPDRYLTVVEARTDAEDRTAGLTCAANKLLTSLSQRTRSPRGHTGRVPCLLAGALVSATATSAASSDAACLLGRARELIGRQ
eukprot:6833131-Prymnesium_polylepis.2